MIVNAEYDVLKDETVRFAIRLQRAGVAAHVLSYPGMLHGFYEYPAVVGSAVAVWEAVGDRIRGIV